MSVILMWISFVISSIAVLLFIMLLLKPSTSGTKRIEQAVRNEFRSNRDESAKTAKDLREEVASAQKSSTETLINTISEISKLQKNYLDSVEKRIKELTTSNESHVDKIRETLEKQMKSLQDNNEKKLEQMRHTVDEKLQTTLERRLGESFKIVSKQLEAVQVGLGKMQNLASSVGDLKRVLTNVKARGTWGEVQLGAILEQILTPVQYGKNVQIREGSQERVDYAIRLPGADNDQNSDVWLPIDSKFPQEDYLRLVSAADAADTERVKQAQESLARAIKVSAKDIAGKSLDPPRTTDFAIMFLPTEGLYAEVLRQPDLIENLQQNYRVVVAGPTTLSAILNSLRMGFQTLAIGKQSSEVWKVLAAVKTEFSKFSNVLAKVKKQLETASNTIDQTSTRTRVMQRKLREVERLPEDASEKLLGLSNIQTDEEIGKVKTQKMLDSEE